MKYYYSSLFYYRFLFYAFQRLSDCLSYNLLMPAPSYLASNVLRLSCFPYTSNHLRHSHISSLDYATIRDYGRCLMPILTTMRNCHNCLFVFDWCPQLCVSVYLVENEVPIPDAVWRLKNGVSYFSTSERGLCSCYFYTSITIINITVASEYHCIVLNFFNRR